MIGIWQAYSDLYLYVAGVAMLAAFGIPLLLVPLRWASVYRWELPQPENLAVMLGRTLGLFISLIAVFAFRAASSPAAKPFFFDLMLCLVLANLVLHVYGAIKKTQPVTETGEILLWAILFVATLAFYPS